MGLAVAILLAVGCSKSHQCKCVTTDVNDDGALKLITVGGGTGCDDITEWAYEIQVVDSAARSHSLARRETHTVKCREYGE